MTENEAIKSLEYAKRIIGLPEQGEKWGANRETIAMDMAIKSLEEIQQYRAIGTVEECREAKERQRAKKPTPIDYEKYMGVVNNTECLRGAYWCPNCKHVVHSGSYCNDCGQAIDWSELDTD